jgi:hypothetical protein
MEHIAICPLDARRGLAPGAAVERARWRPTPLATDTIVGMARVAAGPRRSQAKPALACDSILGPGSRMR